MSITATERTQIVELTTLMFNAAPGATYLSQIVALYEANGHNLSVLADQLASTSIYKSMNPSFQTAAEFATKFLTPLGLAGDAFANSWITSQLNAGVSKQQVAYAAMQALMNLDPNASAQYQAAKAVLVNKTTVAEYYSATLLGAATDLATLQTVIGSVTADPASVTSSEAVLNNQIITGITQNLTAGVDNFNGTSGNDTFNGQIGAGATLTALDSINGGTGTDTLNINDVTGGQALPGGVTIQNVEIINLASAGAATFDVSGIAGVTNFNVTQSSGNDAVTAAATTNVTVNDTGAAGTVSVDGGNNVGVNAAGAVTIGGVTKPAGTVTVVTTGAATVTGGTTQTITAGGAVTLSKASGAIAVTDTAQGAGTIGIDDGTNVSVTTTTNSTGSITIGATTKPTGTVSVTENLKGTGALTGGNITVNGGTVDNVVVNATQATAGTTTTVGTIAVNGSAVTTAVAVTETPVVAPVAAVTAVAGVTESGSAVFTALTAGQTLIVGGLTFTAGAAGTTAAQTAAAFANLTAGALQGNSTLGTYSGQLAGWTSTAVSGTATVVFTSTTANTNVADLAFTGTGTAPTITETQGAAATAAVAGVGGIADGAVNITDKTAGSGTGTINYVQLSGYGTSTIASDALATLSLANSAAGVTVTDKGATALALSVNNLGAGSTLNLDGVAGTYKTLNITTTGADSADNITASGVTALTVGGTNAIDLTGSTLTALKTVVVSGSAGLTMASGANVTDINASATSGNVTVTAFDGTKATYEGGTGVDKLTLSTVNPSKAISLGDGNDTLTLAAGTTAPTATLDGGAGTDTLSMAGADAATASATTTFASKVVNFEHLTVTGAGTNAIDLAALGNYTFVTDAGAGTTDTFNNMASGGTLVFTGTGSADIVNVTNAATGTADSLNVVLQAAGALSDNTTVANVESVAITANDTTKGVAAGATSDFAVVTDSALTSATVLGNTTLNLTLTSTKISTVDASGMTGGLVYTTTGTVAETVKGGASANQLTAHTGTVADTLIGGAGNDTITANGGLDTLTGGGGNDTFVVTPSANVNSYATITDANAGDSIKLSTTGAITFTQSKVTLASTAVFQDYANAVIAGTAQGNIAWFQYGGDTYVVQHEQAGGTAFLNGTDLIVKLAGLVDLSHTSLNTTSATLLVG